MQDCVRCPRLAEHAREIREAFPGHFAKPVGAWGDARAKILLVGLAPGLHGAFRTGKAFVGDASGEVLFAALAQTDLADHLEPAQAKLNNIRITNVVKCLPPANAPLAIEVNNCRPWLVEELRRHVPEKARRPRAVIALGGIAYRSVVRALGIVRPPPFSHGLTYELRPGLLVMASYHPSRLNVNTGRINQAMLAEVFASASAFVDREIV